MKQKLTFLFALLCVSVMGWAIDWSGYEWIGNGSGNAAYTDKFKMTLATGQAYVNIQEPGFATAPGIYTTFPAGVTSCSLPASAYDVQGAGMILHVAYFTAQETEITVVHGEGTAVFTVYYADGTTGGGSLTDPELSLNETAVTLDATVPETFQINPSQNGDGAISYESSNTNIASVSSTGLVTAVGRGTATITVRTAETATYAADSETLTVTVNGPINWAALSWIGNGSGDAANTEKWKMAEHSYVNIQHPGFASEAGIYAEFTAPIVYCSLGEGNYAVQGAGICMYLSAFTAEVTEVLVIGNHVQSIFYVYKDGATGTASLNDIIPTNIYDTNFALETNGGWASATSGTAWLGNNGDDGDRWEGASSDPQVYTLDLGRRRIFNTVQIRWEGAYAKTFTIQVSNDAETWTTVKTITDQVLDDFPYEQTLDFSEQTARYIRFNGTARGTGYGYSFWEFRVLLPGVSVLTSIDLSAGAAIAEVGGAGVVLTAQPKDQNGQNMAESVSWEITPAAAGHMSGNTYIPDQNGTATIRAYNGDVYSSSITIYGYSGTNLALSTNISSDNKVIAQSASYNDAFYAVDTDEGGVWQGAPTDGTDGDDAGRTYDAWFVVDLGDVYDINLVTIKFEGACSELYHLDFSENNSTWSTGYNYVGSEGVNGHTDYLTESILSNNTKVRYVRFWSTKAATGYGMKVFDMKVFGTEWVDSGDTEAPVMGLASLDSKTWKSAIINVAATDVDGTIAKYHVVNTTPAIDAEYIPSEGKITISGLTAETAYNFTITAIDGAGHESANSASVAFTTNVHHLAPVTAAPTPTWPSAQVLSLYSDTYTFAPSMLVSYCECWWDCPNMTEGNIGGNHYLDYNLYRDGMIGAQFGSISASLMEKLHIDIFASDNGSVAFRLITNEAPAVVVRKTLELEGEQWNSFDIDLSDFGEGHNWNGLYQFAIEYYNAGGLVGEHICVDNIYLYRTTPIEDNEVPTSLTANLVSTGFYSAILSVQAEDNMGVVNYSIKNGSVEVANGAGASGETIYITVNGLTAGTLYNLSVTASDAAGNETEPVVVNATTRALPPVAPTPVFGNNVIIPVFTDAMAGEISFGYGGWGEATTAQMLQLSASDRAFHIANLNFIGWHSFAAIDATNMMFLHLDVYSTGMTSIGITPISPNHELSTSQSLTPNAWTSLDIPLSVYASANIDWSNIFQFKFDNPVGGTEALIDNVYFWQPGVLTTPDNGGETGGWATFSPAAKVAVPSGLTAYKATYEKNATEEILSLTDIGGVIPAGAGVILKGTANTTYAFSQTNDDAPDMTGNVLVGCPVRTDISSVAATNDIFCLRYSELFSMTGFFLYSGQYIPAGKAYLALPKEGPSPAPNRRLRFVIGHSTPTGVENVQGNDVQCTKVIENGQLLIHRGEAVYTIQGARVK